MTAPGAADPIPWADRDDRDHPSEPHWCRCRCDETLDRNCSEHGWQVAAVIADADPAELVTAEMVMRASDAGYRGVPLSRPIIRPPIEFVHAALTSVAADLYARGLTDGRQECAEELWRTVGFFEAEGYRAAHLIDTADRWAGQEET